MERLSRPHSDSWAAVEIPPWITGNRGDAMDSGDHGLQLGPAQDLSGYVTALATPGK